MRRPIPVLTVRQGCAGLALLAAALTGCGTMSRSLSSPAPDSPRLAMPSAVTADDHAEHVPYGVAAGAAVDVALTPVAAPVSVEPVVEVTVQAEAVALEADGQQGENPSMFVAQAPARPSETDEYDVEEWDPFEPFNERMFAFNRRVDQYVLKPVAKGWDKVVPDEVQRMIANSFDNLESLRRMVNSLLQMKWDGAVRELSRFMVNTTMGVGGLFDMGKAAGIEKSREDFGQTLGFYGLGPGPYLVLPFYPPSTVRDFIGRTVDGFLNPLRYVFGGPALFFEGIADPMNYVQHSWERIVVDVTEVVNERSLNLELFQGFEETVIDMYSAVRHAYLERRRNLIRE